MKIQGGVAIGVLVLLALVAFRHYLPSRARRRAVEFTFEEQFEYGI